MFTWLCVLVVILAQRALREGKDRTHGKRGRILQCLGLVERHLIDGFWMDGEGGSESFKRDSFNLQYQPRHRKGKRENH
jgi:hypothetical protein